MFLSRLFRHLTYQVFSPGSLLRERYETFREILRLNKEALELMAEVEGYYHNRARVDFSAVADRCSRLSDAVGAVVDGLIRMSPMSYAILRDYFKKIEFYVRYRLTPLEFDISPPYMIPLQDVPFGTERLAGGKAYNLSRVARELKLPVPRGFVITSRAYNYFCEVHDLRREIQERLADLDISDAASVESASRRLQEMIVSAELPQAIEEEVSRGWRLLAGGMSRPPRVAARSSAVGEDSRISFAGQYLTELCVGESALCSAYKRVIASKFSARALSYRICTGLLDAETPMAVLFTEMIDARSSGVLYSVDPAGGGAGHMVLCSVWGLGEPLVSGSVTPDRYELSRGDDPHVLKRETAEKTSMTVMSFAGGLAAVPVDHEARHRPSIDDGAAAQLGRWATELECLLGSPVDVEWCADREGSLFILQARPLRADACTEEADDDSTISAQHPVLLRGGERASSGTAAGRVFKVHVMPDLDSIPHGSVLVAASASPEFSKAAPKISAAVFDSGSAAGHFASVARELGIPAIVNAIEATKVLNDGEAVTVDAGHCVVYGGTAVSLPSCPSRRDELFDDSPFMTRLRSVLEYISPLNLTDPGSAAFRPEGCRTFHDIIRYAHERAIHEMFTEGKRGNKTQRGARQLITRLPITLYMVDLGGGIMEETSRGGGIRLSEVRNRPLLALWDGLCHRDIHWSAELHHLDWEELERLSMGGGIVSLDSPLLSSFAVLAGDYLNLSIRFGYHFSVVDSFCTEREEENYICFSFKGGGSACSGIMLRVRFLIEVLTALGFRTQVRGDLVDARMTHMPADALLTKIRVLGSLLGVTRLMDYVLKDEETVDALASRFLAGDYRFGHLRRPSERGE